MLPVTDLPSTPRSRFPRLRVGPARNNAEKCAIEFAEFHDRISHERWISHGTHHDDKKERRALIKQASWRRKRKKEFARPAFKSAWIPARVEQVLFLLFSLYAFLRRLRMYCVITILSDTIFFRLTFTQTQLRKYNCRIAEMIHASLEAAEWCKK